MVSVAAPAAERCRSAASAVMGVATQCHRIGERGWRLHQVAQKQLVVFSVPVVSQRG